MNPARRTNDPPRSRWALCLLVAAFLAVGAIYNATTPLFEAPDEQWHFAFVQHLAAGGGLPVYGQDPQAAYRAEGFQPPLYYLTAAPLVSLIDTGGWAAFAVPNPQAAIGLPQSDRNKNAVVHTDEEGFPYAGTPLAVHLVRAVSLLWGLITVLATFFIACEILPAAPVLAYAAAALVAFNPQFLFINSAVNNDTAVTALCTVALLLTVRLLIRGSSIARLGALGVALGLAAISKLNALPMFGLVGVALLVLGCRERSWRGLMGKSALVFGLAALVGGWWFGRNLALYGDPLAQNVWYGALGNAPTGTPLLDLLPEMEGLELSFWAVFGWMNVLADQAVYDIIRMVTRVAVTGLAVWFALEALSAWSRRRQPDRAEARKNEVVGETPRPWTPSLGSMGFLALWLVLTFAMLIRYMQTIKGAQGRLLFPAISVIAIFLVVGLARLVPRKLHTSLTITLAGITFLLAVVAPFRYIQPAYARPPVVSGMDEVAIPNPTRIRYGSSLELLGYEMSRRIVAPGEAVNVRLYWRATAAVSRNYSVYLHVRTPDGGFVGQYDSIPGGGLLPTSIWRPGDVLVDNYTIPISPTLVTPGMANLSVGLYSVPNLAVLQAYDPAGRSITPVIARLRVRLPSAPVPPGPPLYVLGSSIALERSQSPGQVRAGGSFTVSLEWRCLATVDRDYTVFLHAVNSAGTTVAQADGEPQQGALPTSFWERGELVPDSAVMNVPAELPAGEYQLVLGMYDLTTGQRLPAADATGQPSGDSIVLGSVVVD
jgi:hypothetical protein